MKLKVKTKLNDRQMLETEFEGKMEECLRGANALMAFDGKCGLCGETNILLQTKMAKSYCFIEYVCTKCQARAQWGSFLDGGYFLKKWEHWQGEANKEKVVNVDKPEVEEELPF